MAAAVAGGGGTGTAAAITAAAGTAATITAGYYRVSLLRRGFYWGCAAALWGPWYWGGYPYDYYYGATRRPIRRLSGGSARRTRRA